MFKKRVKFSLFGSPLIQIGYLVKDRKYTNKFKVVSANKRSAYCISMLSMIEKF